MGQVLKLLLIIITLFITGSCSQYGKVTCPVYTDNMNSHRIAPVKHKSVRLNKSINSAYRSFYKKNNDKTTKNQGSKNNRFGKSDNSMGNRINDLYDTLSTDADIYASVEKSLSLKKSYVPAFSNPEPLTFGKSYNILNKHPSRKDFKKDLRHEIKKIKTDDKNPDDNPGVKPARQSVLFGLIGIGSILLLLVPIIRIIAVPAMIVFSILAILKGKNALYLLDKSNYKSILQAKTGKTLGMITLILIAVAIVLLAALFILFLSSGL